MRNPAIIKKLVIALGIILFISASFGACLFFFLPRIVSSERFKDLLERQVSSALNRDLQIEELTWGWSDDLWIKNIRIVDDPAFSSLPMLTVRSAKVKVFLTDILDGRVRFDCAVDGIHAVLIRSKSEQTNFGMLLAQILRIEAAQWGQVLEDLKNMSFFVPFDIHSSVHLNHISIRLEDRLQDIQAELQDAAVRFDMPSLSSEPITLQASTDIAIDNKKIPSAHLYIFIKNIFDPKGKFALSNATFGMEGVLPGARLTFNSDLNTLAMYSTVEIDLGASAKVLKPFIPEQVQLPDLMGHLRFVYHSSGKPHELLVFNTTMEGKDLILSNGFLGGESLGPVSVNAGAWGVLDPAKGRLSVSNSKIVIEERSRLICSGEVRELYSPAPRADVVFESIRLDIGDLLDEFKAFMPKGIKLNGKPPKRLPILEINNARVSGPLPSGPHDISIKDLVIKIPDLHFAPEESQAFGVSAKDVMVTVNDLTSVLEQFFPAQLSLSASLKSESVHIIGTKAINVKGLSVSDFTVISDVIHRSENPLIGLTARFNVHEELKVDEISIPTLISVNNVRSALDAEIGFPPKANAELTVKDLTVELPSIRIENARYGPFETSAKLTGSRAEISLASMDPPSVDIKGLQSDFSIDNILVGEVEADAEDMASGGLKTRGNIFIKMNPLSEKFISRFFDKLKLTGTTKFDWDISGRLPNDTETAKFGSSSINFKKDLDFIDRVALICRLEEMGAELNVSENHRLKIASISTGRPLRYSFDPSAGKGRFGGKILLQGIDGAPFKIGGETRLSADICISGEHDYFESAVFSQAMELKPANINQTFDLFLTGIDRILKRNLKMPLPLWFNYVGGTARGTLKISDQTDLGVLADNLEVEGELGTGAELFLAPGDRVNLKAWATSPALNVKLGKLIDVDSLKANINLKKDYMIIYKEEIDHDVTAMVPLSVRVLEAEPEPAAGSLFGLDARDAAAAKFTGDLPNRSGTRRAIAFQSAYVGLGPVPLSLDRSVIDVDLNEGLPYSDFFQIELWGGTVLGSVAVLRKHSDFFLQLRLGFSGLDAGKIYPDAGAGNTGDSEVSGRLWARLPLSSRMSTLLQAFQMDLYLSHIGPRSLERFLYALDPSESNEVIVSQRRLLRLGSPRWINVSIKDGNLSLDGEADAGGVPVKIPSLRRLNIANVYGFEKYEAYLAGLDGIVEILKICAADAVQLGKKGELPKFHTLK